MSSQATGFRGFLAPIWQEVSSLWSGADFAYLDQAIDTDDQETPSGTFIRASAVPGGHSPVESGQFEHCCC